MSRYLFDTNVVSSLIRERGTSPAFRRGSDNRDKVCTSIIVAAEVRFGIVRKGSARLQREASRVLDGLPILPFEAPADAHYAALRAHLERQGRPISANALLIAAHCLALDATLVTHNTREFERVPKLKIVDWLVP